MSTKSELLSILQDQYGSFVSGEKVASKLGLSRAAINKAAASLQKAGYKILSRPNQGYKLLEKTDLLSREAILASLGRPCRLYIEEGVGSVNEAIKKFPFDGSPLAFVDQRKGPCPGASVATGDTDRPAESKGGGIYLRLAVCLSPCFAVSQVSFALMASALACCLAMDEVAASSTKIQWLNDIYRNGKPVATMHTEALCQLETGRIDRLIVGLIVRCFPDEKKDPGLSEKKEAGFLADQTGAFSRATLAGRIIHQLLGGLQGEADIKQLPAAYRRRCFVMGKNIRILAPGAKKPIRARVLDVDEEGALVIEYMEGLHMREIVHLRNGQIFPD